MATKKDRLIKGYFPATLYKAEKEDGITHILTFGRYYTQGGCMFEVKVEFHEFENAGDTHKYMQLHIFTDTFLHLHRFQKVLDALQDYARNHGGREFGYHGHTISYEQFIELLEGLGYRNVKELQEAGKIAA